MLKRAVIKEELFELTGSMEEAVILNQMIYWAERRKDVEQYLAEESKRMKDNSEVTNLPLTAGWIYKTAEELAEEVMLGVSANTIRRHLNRLVDKDYISKRNNPKYKWDKTLQYRVNSIKVREDLQKLDYPLEDFPLLSRNIFNSGSIQQIKTSNLQNGESMLSNCAAIPEITTDITSKNITQTSSSESVDEEKDFNYSNPLNLIKKTYLDLSRKKKLSASDLQAIEEVARQGWNTHQIVNWIKDCFRQFKPKHNRDYIRSFQYVANYIYDQAAELNTKEDIKDGTNSRYNFEDEFFKQYG